VNNRRPLLQAAACTDRRRLLSETYTMTPKPSTSAPGSLALERLSHVRSRTGLSRSEIYRRIALGEFPAPVKLGPRISAWHTAEIDAWIAQRIAARDQGARA
jgi:prophage regulatory protein